MTDAKRAASADPGSAPHAFQVRELKDPSQRDEWNRLVRSVPQGDLLQSWEWGDLKAGSGWQPARLVVDGPEGPVGGISLLSRRVRDLVRESLPIPRAIPVPDGALCYAPHGPVVPFDNAPAVRAVV